MQNIWIITIAIFLSLIILLWMVTNGPMKKEYGMKMWKQGASRLSYWQAIIYISAGITLLLLFVLRWLNVLSF